jgi:hypothetical protein
MRTTLPSPAVLRPTGHRYRRVLVLDQVGRLIGFVTTYPGELVAHPPRHQGRHVRHDRAVPGDDAVAYDDPPS